jgi:hypothetical protein
MTISLLIQRNGRKKGCPMLRWWLDQHFSFREAFRNSVRFASVSFGFPLKKSGSSITNSAKGFLIL